MLPGFPPCLSPTAIGSRGQASCDLELEDIASAGAWDGRDRHSGGTTCRTAVALTLLTA